MWGFSSLAFCQLQTAEGGGWGSPASLQWQSQKPMGVRSECLLAGAEEARGPVAGSERCDCCISTQLTSFNNSVQDLTLRLLL